VVGFYKAKVELVDILVVFRFVMFFFWRSVELGEMLVVIVFDESLPESCFQDEEVVNEGFIELRVVELHDLEKFATYHSYVAGRRANQELV
jgi:hypothetical protein